MRRIGLSFVACVLVAGFLASCAESSADSDRWDAQPAQDRFLNLTCPYTLAFDEFENIFHGEDSDIDSINTAATKMVAISDQASQAIEKDTFAWPTGVKEQLNVIRDNYEKFRPNWVDASKPEKFSEVFFAYDTVVSRERDVADQEIRYLLGMSPDFVQTCRGRELGLEQIEDGGNAAADPPRRQVRTSPTTMTQPQARERYLAMMCPAVTLSAEFNEEIWALEEIPGGPSAEQMEKSKTRAAALVDPTRAAVAASEDPKFAWPVAIADEITVLRAAHLEQLANWVTAANADYFFQIWYSQDILASEPRDQADSAVRSYLGLSSELPCDGYEDGLDDEIAKKVY